MKTQILFALIASVFVIQSVFAAGDRSVHFRVVSRAGCSNEFTLAKDGDDYFIHGDGCFRAPDFALGTRKHSSHNYIFNGNHPEEITVINSQGDRKIVSLDKSPREYGKAAANSRKLTALIVQQASRQNTDRTAEPNARSLAREIKKKLATANRRTRG